MADSRFKVTAVDDFKESAVDCPVQLKKYQIIYDVIADKTYLRVVFENFSSQKIVGVFLNVDCLDIFEKKFAEVAKASVKVECDKKFSEFGKECPVAIPTGTKSVKAYIVRVVFSDMTVWENRDLTFVAPVSDLKPYTEVKEKEQLEKELAKRNYGAKYLPVRYERCWRCTCGHLNGNDSDMCSACKSRASVLFNIFDNKNLETCKKEDTYNEARKCDASKDYLQASKLYRTILDYKDSKVLFAKALENSKEAIYISALDTLKTAQKEENFDSAIKSLSSISEYKDAKTQIEKAKEQKNEFIYNQALQRVKKDNVGKNDFDKSIYDMQRIPSYKDSREKIKEIDAQKQAFLDKKEHARKMKKVRNISIVACVITAIVIAILIPYFIEPNLYTKETTYEEITIGDQSGYCLVKYNENEEKVVIPSEYLGKPVLKIGARAFQGKFIKEITIPESVRQIGYDAFAKCKNLNAVYYTDVEKWCQISFGNSNANPLNYAHNLYLNGELLTDLTIPDGVAVDQYAFIGCSALQNITAGSVAASTIAKSCQSPSFNVVITYGGKIDRDAFNGCKGLKNITLSADVKSIGYEAFDNCSSLENIYYNGDVAKWCVISGLDELMSSTRTLYIGGQKVEGDLVIPDGVKSIFNSAFAYCNGLTSVTISNSVTNIDDYAFCGCTSLTDITIPDSVTSIGEFVFYGCSNLTSIALPFVGASKTASDGYDQVFGYIFGYDTRYLSSESVSGATYQYSSVYLYYHYYIPSSIKSVMITGDIISENAFYNCSGLTSVTIGNSVTSIGDYAFSGCYKLVEVYNKSTLSITAGSPSNGYVAYYAKNVYTEEGGSKLATDENGYVIYTEGDQKILVAYTGTETDLVLPTYITKIYQYAFYNCSGLTSITIPDSVTGIGSDAFDNCTGLTSIAIPDSVTSIGNSAFHGCSALESITIPFVGAKAGVTSRDTYQYPFGYIFGTSSYTGGVATMQNYYGSSTSSTTYDYYYIPSSLKSVTVTGGNILYGAFYNCSKLTSITIPDSVTSIGSDVFYGCSGLTSITIPDSVTSIASAAFDDTAWYNNQPDGLVYAGKVAYKYKGTMLNNTSIVIKEGTILIVDSAFSGCSGLTSITIPDSVTSIGNYAFDGCDNLQNIYMTDMVAWCNIFGLNNLMKYGASSKNLYLDNELVTSVTIPDGVTAIHSYAFRSFTSLTNITIPDGVKSIGSYAFYDCSGLTSVRIPAGVTSIEDSAFYGCSKLQDIYITDIVAWCNVSGLSNLMNHGSNNKQLYLNDELVTSVTIPDGVTAIPSSAFRSFTGLTIVTIGNSVTSIGSNAFSDCIGLTRITGSSNATSVIAKQCGASTFEVVITSGTSIGTYAFYNCNGLTSITIPNSVTSIGSYAFYNCGELTSVTIPNSVTSIGMAAFRGCSGLTSMTLPFVGASVTASKGYDEVFGYIFGYTTTSSSSSAVSEATYQYTEQYSVSYNRYEYRYYYYYIPSSIKSVTITGGNIPSNAFYNCSGLTSITIPDSVTSIGNSAFYNTAWYNNQPDGLMYAGKVAYKYKGTMPSNTSIIIKEGTHSITGSAFYGCSGLTSVTIPDSVTSIGDYAFDGCSGLTSVTIPNSVTSIGTYAFYGCSSLTSITLPDSVTSIGERTFCGCTGLTSITIPDSVTRIGEAAFWFCSGLKKVFYVGSEEQWKAISIGSDNSALTSAARVYNYDGVERTYLFVTNCDQSIDPITATYLSSLPTLTRDGYYFCGWYDNEPFEGKAVCAPYCSKDKTTLYAKWLTEEEWNALPDGTSFEKAYVAESGQTYDVSITTGGQIVYFVFTPTTSGSFTIQSTGSGDTYGTLYSSSKSSLTYNDDGSGRNFKITYTMTAGTTYYVAVKFYGSSTTGTFKVSFS